MLVAVHVQVGQRQRPLLLHVHVRHVLRQRAQDLSADTWSEGRGEGRNEGRGEGSVWGMREQRTADMMSVAAVLASSSERKGARRPRAEQP